MTETIQTLGVVERLFPEILNGTKTSTIRWNEPVIVPGPLRFICDGNPDQTVLVEVLSCKDMLLSDAAAYLDRQKEWPDEVMLEGMREHYPEIQLSSLVQVIEFELPQT